MCDDPNCKVCPFAWGWTLASIVAFLIVLLLG